MPRFIYYTGCSLDGFVADRDGSLDWLINRDIDPEGPGGSAAFDASVGAMVMGRATYDWVHAELTATGQAWPHHQPVWVMTRREPPAPIQSANITFTGAAVEDVAQAMREAAGDLDCWIVGGGTIASAFAEAGLMDEVVVSLAPVFLGGGTPVLTRETELELLSVDRNRDFAVLRYAVR